MGLYTIFMKYESKILTGSLQLVLKKIFHILGNCLQWSHIPQRNLRNIFKLCVELAPLKHQAFHPAGSTNLTKFDIDSD